jgi:hypothetical protein
VWQFFWEDQFFCEGKLKEGRTEKAKSKTEKESNDFWLSLFVIYGDVIRSSYLSCFFPWRKTPSVRVAVFFGRTVFFM